MPRVVDDRQKDTEPKELDQDRSAKEPQLQTQKSPQRVDDRKQSESINVQQRSRYPRFFSFLKSLTSIQNHRTQQTQTQLETHYRIWAIFFEQMKNEFKEVWELFGTIENDSPGWFRGSPNNGQWDFLGTNPNGYSFAASIEQNHQPNAPFAHKWLIVSLAHSPSNTQGIGDERMLGRKSELTDELEGLEACQGMDPEQQIKVAESLVRKAQEYPLLFSLHDDRLGQNTAKVPLEVFRRSGQSLATMCQGLFVALNNDVFEDFRNHLPEDGIELLTDGRPKLIGS